MKLMLLIMPTIQTIVNAGRERRRSSADRCPAPNGLPIERRSLMPGRRARAARGRAGRGTASAPGARSGRRGSRGPSRARRPTNSATSSVRPERSSGDGEVRRTSLIASQADAHDDEGGRDRDAAAARDWRRVTRRASGWSTTSRRRASRRTSGVSTSASSADASERRDEERQESPKPGSGACVGARLTPVAGRPGHREAGADVADLGRGAGRWTAASSRRWMASTISRPIARISSGPEAARRRRRRADPDAGRRVGRQRVERDRVLVDGDADSSRSCSASLPVTPSGVTSTSIRWLSVPPETTRAPRSASVVGEHLRRSRWCARWSSGTRRSRPA